VAVTASAVAERLAEVHERIAAAGGVPGGVRVVAVTKGFGADAVEAAVAAGVVDLGENYADELVEKSDATGAGSELRRWHFLGRVQRNKVRRVAAIVHLWQAVDRVAAGREIALRAPGARVLVQVNVSGEPQKHGCHFDDVPAVVGPLRALGLDVEGLMAVGPTGPPELARPGYRRLSALAATLGLPERSMGMTDDLEVAVEEGSTMVRLGRALFGARSGVNQLRR
jgi:PLP dependent protein